MNMNHVQYVNFHQQYVLDVQIHKHTLLICQIYVRCAFKVSYSFIFYLHGYCLISSDMSGLMINIPQCMSKVHLTYIEP